MNLVGTVWTHKIIGKNSTIQVVDDIDDVNVRVLVIESSNSEEKGEEFIIRKEALFVFYKKVS